MSMSQTRQGWRLPRTERTGTHVANLCVLVVVPSRGVRYPCFIGEEAKADEDRAWPQSPSIHLTPKLCHQVEQLN